MSTLRPELGMSDGGDALITNGTAYLMIYKAVESKRGLISGRLHGYGESCAIGSFFDVNKGVCLYDKLIDEVAAVNDSVPFYTMRRRRNYVLRWLKWKLSALQMPGFVRKNTPIEK